MGAATLPDLSISISCLHSELCCVPAAAVPIFPLTVPLSHGETWPQGPPHHKSIVEAIEHMALCLKSHFLDLLAFHPWLPNSTASFFITNHSHMDPRLASCGEPDLGQPLTLDFSM